MSRKKTYIDSGVLITAFQGVQSTSIRANSILNDENREFVSSQFVNQTNAPSYDNPDYLDLALAQGCVGAARRRHRPYQ